MADRPDRDAPPNVTDLDAERASFHIDAPERFNYVRDVLGAQASRRPDAEALISLDATGRVTTRHTFRDLAVTAEKAANVLRGLGIGKGDPVFVMLPRIPEWYEVLLGAMRLGAIPMPGTTQLRTRDIAYRIERSDAVAAVTDGDGTGQVDGVENLDWWVRHRLVVGGPGGNGWLSWDDLFSSAAEHCPVEDPTAAADPLLVYFTSGTTAYPKMVMHSQASYGLGHIITARYWHDLRPGDVHWTISDTGWAKAAWGKLFGQWHEGATVVQMNMGKPSAETILQVVQDLGVTSFCAPPTLYRMLVLADIGAFDLSRLRHCTSAGEPLNPEVIRLWEAGTGGLPIYEGYGQTETTNLVATYRSMPVKPGSMGRPAPGYDVDIVDDDGAPVGVGVEANIAVRVRPERPLGLFREYWKDPEATAASEVGDWYITGDRGRKDHDGYLWFEGRADDVITSAAYRIGPFEVESALIEHPAVAEAAVVGRDDPQRTQIVVAFVTLAPGYEPGDDLAAEIQEHVKQTTAPYKYPRQIFFVEEFPKTVSGKIRRTELRGWLREGRY